MTKVETLAIQALAAIAVVAVLIGVALWFKIEAVNATKDRDKWRSTAESLEATNRQNVNTIAVYRKAAEQNAKIADGYAEKLKVIDDLDETSRNRIREIIRNDPQASDWASAVVPLNVRDATRH